MRSFFVQLITLGFLAFLAGCATAPSPSVKSKNPSTKGPAPTTGSRASTGAKTPAEPPLAEGEFRLQIESTPSDAMVVVNGIPVGRTPRTIELAGTKHGFFRDQVSVKVRFISTESTHPSKTVEEMLTPLDKIPAVVKFTPAGATRVARETL
jgi:hypothetical protein